MTHTIIAFYAGVACGAITVCVYACIVVGAQSWTDRTVRRRVLSLEGSRPCKRAIRP